MKNSLRPFVIAIIALSFGLLVTVSASAQDKTQACSNIQIVVDVNKSAGNWSNGAYVLKLQGRGQGWTIAEPGDQRGQNIKVPGGTKLRFNFNDGANHPVNVSPSTGDGKALNVRSGSRPAIVLVDVGPSQSKTGAVKFTIDGANNDKAKINGCTGGNFYIDLE